MRDTRYKRSDVEREEEWEKYYKDMPYIELEKGFKIRAMPPTSGAMLRFSILAPSGNDYSVYYDVFDRLALYGKPYYEVYPYVDSDGYEDVYRSDNVEEILEVIYLQEK